MRWREEQTLTVGGLNRAVKLGLEHEWGNVLVLGEISDVMRAGSGHVYFTLNDEIEAAQVRVVMFKSDVRRTRALLDNGARICVRGSLTLYEARGTYQLLARAAFPAGDGDLQAQFKRTLDKLTAEGLTDQAKKRRLPLLPRCIGVVTSEQGAAVHDVIRVARGRCPVRIVIAPCLVQGPEAPASIVRALRAVQRVPELDVVIITRGGGSAEDLWAFNDEAVARAIAACRVPVVSGVGHEIDTTIADLVADVRAATPSNAAELVVPERAQLDEQLSALIRRLERSMETRIGRERLIVSRLSVKLRDPRHTLGRAHELLEKLELRMVRTLRIKLARAKAVLDEQRRTLAPHDPRARLAAQRAAFARARTRLELSPRTWLLPQRRFLTAQVEASQRASTRRLVSQRHALGSLAGRLEALSPLSVLARGYAIVFSEQTGKALRSESEANPGDSLRIRLHQGEVRARVV